MSEKRRNKPIQIALTEEQIANIIQEAAGQRRDLSVESLEDRIAPSRFGLPVLGGAEDLVDQPDAPEGPEVGGDGTTLDDPLVNPEGDNPDAPFDAAAEGEGDGTTIGDDLVNPEADGGLDPFAGDGPDVVDPNAPGAGPDILDPNAWDPTGGPEGPGFFLEGEIEGDPEFRPEDGGDSPFSDYEPPADVPAELRWVWSQDPEVWAEAIPADVAPEVRDAVMDRMHELNEHIASTVEATGELPPAEELNEHRMSILRNLRDV